MSGSLTIIWDYDGPIGQVNATYPYKFDEQKIIQEIENVDLILSLCEKYNVKMVFACTGFSAEEGHFPYHIQNQIQQIFHLGHEIASHSWKHEWFPYLEREQIVRSLTRSKYALETCIGKEGSVVGFVPPFSRPMSWYARGAVSQGDRTFGYGFPGSNIGSLIKIISGTGYKWCRINYYPLLKKIFSRSAKVNLNKSWEVIRGVTCFPCHHFGFDSKAIDLLDRLSKTGGKLVISAHPSGLSRTKEENVNLLINFLDKVAELRKANTIEIKTINQLT